MTITLMDIYMLTCLDITSSANPVQIQSTPSHRLNTGRDSGGWGIYAQVHHKDGSVGRREHTAFLNMWLDKYFFCGASLGPTDNYQYLAEQLADETHLPMGQFLLGATYRMLNKALARLRAGQPVSNVVASAVVAVSVLSRYDEVSQAGDFEVPEPRIC